MEPETVTLTTPFQRLMYERSLAMEAELTAVGAAAADGRGLADLEEATVRQVAALGRDALEEALRARVAEIEKKGARRAAAPAAADATRRGRGRAP